MALSDEERRRLEELEQELAATDSCPDRQLQDGVPGYWTSPRTVYGLLAASAGFVLVIAGITSQLAVIGVAGFLLMVAGANFLNSLHIGDGTALPTERRDGGGPWD